ncbi:hypothetical protein C9374_003596 [Naegleria lovaniensis]|uniref:Uncharacterized protein n=1 Tax=Naegleria lovaniensis TaxID=51637 RepID=A0AA88KS59_NAELO|nr:uncharacterized protein C9374_003596 [Naegleria lovaniensis]KAG2393832.1 hypothetical protein C9374_003596 [Naegleria lovaniensis]
MSSTQHSPGYHGFDTQVILTNLTQFLNERIFETFLQDSETLNFTQMINLPFMETLKLCLETHSSIPNLIFKIITSLPKFYLNCFEKSLFSDHSESGSKAIVGTVTFLMLMVTLYYLVLRPLTNYLFRVDEKVYLQRVLKKQHVVGMEEQVNEKQENLKISGDSNDTLDIASNFVLNRRMSQKIASNHPEKEESVWSVKFDRKFVDTSYRVYRKEDSRNVWRRIFEILHYLVSLMVLLVYIPYVNYEGYWTYMCFWSYVVMTFFIVGTTIKRMRWLRRFCLFYVLCPAIGFMLISNFSYLYYHLASWSFGFVFVHFVPPFFIWTFVLLNVREFIDENYNFCTSNSFLYIVYNLGMQLVFATIWRIIFDPVEVYSRMVVDVFKYACLVPAIVHFVTFFAISLLRKQWIERYGDRVVLALLVSESKKRN